MSRAAGEHRRNEQGPSGLSLRKNAAPFRSAVGKALRKGHLPLLAAVLLSFPVAGADIRTAANPGGKTVFRSDPFQLECWQEGKRIIHQTGLEGMTLGQALEGKTLSFRGKGEQTASVVLIPFEHSLCMTVSE